MNTITREEINRQHKRLRELQKFLPLSVINNYVNNFMKRLNCFVPQYVIDAEEQTVINETLKTIMGVTHLAWRLKKDEVTKVRLSDKKLEPHFNDLTLDNLKIWHKRKGNAIQSLLNSIALSPDELEEVIELFVKQLSSVIKASSVEIYENEKIDFEKGELCITKK